MFLAVLTAALLLAASAVGTVFASALAGAGTPSSDITTDLYGSFATQRRIVSTDASSRNQQVYCVSFNPKTNVMPEVIYGQYVDGKNTLTAMVRRAEGAEGGAKTVVAAINGDYFDMNRGIAFGMAIVNGKLINNATEITNDAGIDADGTTTRTEEALGFKRDGTAVWGTPEISVSYRVGGAGSWTTVGQVNRRRTSDNYWNDIRLLTEEFSATTHSGEPAGGNGRDVVLRINADDVGKGLTVGGTVRATVESVNHTTAGAESAVPIGAGKMVLTSVNTNNCLNSLTVGASVEIKVSDDSADKKWTDVWQAMGAYRILAENGVKKSPYNTRAAIEPRSAVGIKSNGECVFFEADGRQSHGRGFSYKMLLDFLVDEMGCSTVIELDGGGSSQIMTRAAADSQAVTRNTPSDPGANPSDSHGIQRGLAIAWIIVPRPEYSVTFRADGAQVGSPVSGRYGTPVTPPEVPDKTGHTKAWNAAQLAAVADGMIAGSRTVEAVYTPVVYTVTFRAGINTVAQFNVAYGTAFTGELPAVPPKVGYSGAWDAHVVAGLGLGTADTVISAVYKADAGGGSENPDPPNGETQTPEPSPGGETPDSVSCFSAAAGTKSAVGALIAVCFAVGLAASRFVRREERVKK
jgi:hypothetical protein